MSSMLDQAIIDANALKEAAIKNAENEILEKYSQEIKEAVSTLLEQPEEEELLPGEEEVDLGGPEELGAPDLGAEEESEGDKMFLEQLPSAATGGENLCPCPEDDELVEIDFTELVAEEEEVSEETIDTLEEASAVEEEEQVDINEDELAGLIEELVFGAEGPVPNGYISSNTSEVEEAQEIERVRREIEEENSKNEDLKEELNQYKQQGQKFKRIILELKDKLDEISLENARFLYTNRVLKNASLNERQKDKIVETISSAKTIEEAKVIFETLQSAVAATSHERKPKSLSEAIERKSSRLYHIREQRNISDPAVERMQRLAGIVRK